MIIAYFIVAGLAALAFLGAGGMKLARSKAALAESGMAWTDDFSAGQIRAIAALEVVGAIGLILPMATGIAPVLSPIAAVGLVVIMVGAVVVHTRRAERQMVVVNVVLAVITAAAAVLGILVLVG